VHIFPRQIHMAVASFIGVGLPRILQ